jgi:hypothetical protein
VRDAAAAHGGHIVAIPRDNLPMLTKFGSAIRWQGTEAWKPSRRTHGAGREGGRAHDGRAKLSRWRGRRRPTRPGRQRRRLHRQRVPARRDVRGQPGGTLQEFDARGRPDGTRSQGCADWPAGGVVARRRRGRLRSLRDRGSAVAPSDHFVQVWSLWHDPGCDRTVLATKARDLVSLSSRPAPRCACRCACSACSAFSFVCCSALRIWKISL